MPRLQEEGQRILNALQEGQVLAVIALYKKNIIPHSQGSIAHILEVDLGMDAENVAYWLDFFKVQ